MNKDTIAYEWDIFVSGTYFGSGWFSTNDEDDVLMTVKVAFDKLPFSLVLDYIEVEKSA